MKTQSSPPPPPHDSLVVQKVKNPPAMQESQVRSLDRKDPLGKGMTTHSSILAWEIPWTEEPGRLQSTGSQRVRHNRETEHAQRPPPQPHPEILFNAPFQGYTDTLVFIHKQRLRSLILYHQWPW